MARIKSDDEHHGTSSLEIQKSIRRHLHHTQAKPALFATTNDWYMATAHAVRDQMLGGYTEFVNDPDGRLAARWIPEKLIRGVAYDTPVAGYNSPGGVAALRLWKSEVVASFDFQAFCYKH